MKKRSLSFFALCVVVLYGFGQENNTFNIGQKSVVYKDDSRNRPLLTEIWYPTKDKILKDEGFDKQRTPFVGIETITNADFPEGRFPLLMVSHGTGGNRFSLTCKMII